MIDRNRKRYVYMDRYLEFQDKLNGKIVKLNNRINLLTFVVMGLIVAASYSLYKIFG